MLDTVFGVCVLRHSVGGVLGGHGWRTGKAHHRQWLNDSITSVLLRFDAIIKSQYDIWVLIIGDRFGVP